MPRKTCRATRFGDRFGMQIMPRILAALALLALASCDDKPQAPGQGAVASPSDPRAQVRRAAEEAVRARLNPTSPPVLRAVHVYGQQPADTFAVCGQVEMGQGSSVVFVPWVAPVVLRDGTAVVSDLFAGVTNAEASRVYIESIDRCFEGGGAHPTRARQVRPLPPLPHDAGAGQVQASPPSVAGPARPAAVPDTAVPARLAATQPAPTPAPEPIIPRPAPREDAASGGGVVTTRAAHPVNIRNAPSGSGAVVRTVPRASQLRVFGEAPGGWLQVGDGEPFGWLHSSMLER